MEINVISSRKHEYLLETEHLFYEESPQWKCLVSESMPIRDSVKHVIHLDKMPGHN